MLSPKNQERLNQAVEDTATSAKALVPLIDKLNVDALPIRLIAKEDECRNGETIRSMASRGVLGVRDHLRLSIAAAKIGRWDVALVFLAINRIGRVDAERLSHMTASACGGTDGMPLSADEAARLLRLNRHLAKMEGLLNTVATTLTPALSAKVADPADPMDDYELETQVHYTLREDDPEWSDDNDNFLTNREVSLKRGLYRFEDGADHREFMPSMEAVNTEPHCWSFHDLWDHEYGLTKPRVPLRDCLRLGSAWMEVVIRQQYSLNLDTGEWDKEVRSPATST